MQLEMFEVETQPGTYVAPKPKVPTALESLNLRPLLERFWPMLNESEVIKQIWTWQREEEGVQWSALTNTILLLAIHGTHAEAVPFTPATITSGARLRGYVEDWLAPPKASRITFAALRDWAKAAEWPTTCFGCGGGGTGPCTCGAFSQCQICGGSGVAICPICDQNGIALPKRPQRIEKTMINANLLACALETIAPAVAPAQCLWMWRDENGGRPAIRFESRDWRLLVMAQKSEEKKS